MYNVSCTERESRIVAESTEKTNPKKSSMRLIKMEMEARGQTWEYESGRKIIVCEP